MLVSNGHPTSLVRLSARTYQTASRADIAGSIPVTRATLNHQVIALEPGEPKSRSQYLRVLGCSGFLVRQIVIHLWYVVGYQRPLGPRSFAGARAT